MTQVAIFKRDDGVVAVLIPTPEALQTYSIMEIAIKDIPYGKKFKIMNFEDLPNNAVQESWVVSDDELTDGVGKNSNGIGG